MATIVSGTTGHLGRLVVEHLLARGVAASDIVGAGRAPEKLAALTESTGVRTAVIDFSDSATLDAALVDADSFVLVSGTEPGQRVAQHRNAIDAAKRAGVDRVVYTSSLKATNSSLILAPDHKATEEAIAASGIPATILRNGWYHENHDDAYERAARTGVYIASTGDGRVASAPRTDYAEAIAAVLTTDGHAGAIYELSGNTAWTGSEFAAAASAASGREISYRSLSSEEHFAALTAEGIDEGAARFVVALDANMRDGLLGGTSGDLSRLIAHPTQPLTDHLIALVQKYPQRA
jgi:NAD(P)H dehydrogenase (quinone)